MLGDLSPPLPVYFVFFIIVCGSVCICHVWWSEEACARVEVRGGMCMYMCRDQRRRVHVHV